MMHGDTGYRVLFGRGGAVTAGWLAAALLLAAGLAGCKTTAGEADTAARQAALDKAMVVGHRGAAGLRPENTLPAVEAGLAAGADAVEVDVQLSADGVPVVYHDLRLKPALTRGPSGDWLDEPGPAVSSLTVDQLKRYDVGRLAPGSDYADRYPDQRPVDGTRIPTLEQVLRAVKAAGDAEIWVELKTDPTRAASSDPTALARATLAALEKTGMTDRARLLSFDWRGLKTAGGAGVPRVYLTASFDSFDTLQRGRSGASPWLAGVDIDAYPDVPAAVAAAGGSWWAPYYRQLGGRDGVQAARDAGLKVAVWTVDERARAVRLIAAGVDAVITNRPDRMGGGTGS